jgi:cytoskeletal protein CcmA (bactofilin family)
MMNPVKRTSDSAHEHNRIVEGAVFEGSIQSPVDIRVDGLIKGNVRIQGKLVVGPTGSVEGEVVAAEASIAGKLRGSLEVKGLTTLAQTAQVQAELYTGQISIEAGAQFSGNCHMGPKEPISKPINPAAAVPAAAPAAPKVVAS